MLALIPVIAAAGGWLLCGAVTRSITARLAGSDQWQFLAAIAAGVLAAAVEAASLAACWPLIRRARRQGAILRRVLQARDRERSRHKAGGRGTRHEVSLKLCHALLHEFNNLMSAILAAADMASEISADPVLQSSMKSIFDAVQVGQQLGQRVLAVDPDAPLVPTRSDVGVDLRAASARLAQAAGGAERLRLFIVDSPLPALIDHAHLVTCVAELVGNAHAASPGSAPIHVSARVGAQLTPMGHDALMVVIEVEDSGPGMSEADLASATAPLFTTRDGALGLGLPMVHNFMRASGGTLELRSQPGRGTRATLWVPMDVASEIDLAAARPHGKPHGRVAARLLLVDDNSPLRAALARRLRERGFVVVEAADVETAARSLRDDLDVVVTDVVLGGDMDGYALGRLARARDPTVGLVFMSGFISARQPELLASDELASFMRKPVEFGNLLTVVSGLLASRESRKSSPTMAP